MGSMKSRLVVDGLEACSNIRHFETELSKSSNLAGIMSYGRAWYACRTGRGWSLGPSKFVGYAANDAKIYLSTHRQRDGRLTERILSQWFDEVPPGSPIYQELHSCLRTLFAKHDKSPNKLFRFYVFKSDLSASDLIGRKAKSAPKQELSSRITINSDICFGRPCIRGMRIRVSDVLDLLAAGNDKSQILADYPYLESQDLDAVLEYASRAVRHRIIEAA
jgi:uncharacterized protein (DUF433 family)